jgi:hypothetical protein
MHCQKRRKTLSQRFKTFSPFSESLSPSSPVQGQDQPATMLSVRGLLYRLYSLLALLLGLCMTPHVVSAEDTTT